MKIGLIGGTGLDDPEILLNRSELSFDGSKVKLAANGKPADYGLPSDDMITGEVEGIECVILARHGRKHHLNPTCVNYRANLLALKQAGCDVVIATHSVGSLVEEYKPGNFVLLDNIIDRTQKRELTYYDCKPSSWSGVLHCTFGDPYDTRLRQAVLDASEKVGLHVHSTGTCVAIEGPRFSSRAESRLFKKWGGHLVGMTQVPEAQLAKELDLPFVAIGMVTDYDSWRDTDKPVSAQEVVKVLKGNGLRMVEFLESVIPIIAKSTNFIEKPSTPDAFL